MWSQERLYLVFSGLIKTRKLTDDKKDKIFEAYKIMRILKDIKLQIKVLAIAIFIVLLIAVGAPWNHCGDTGKVEIESSVEQ